MNEAIKSTAIVSSLFPKEVRDRMMEEQQARLSGKSRLQNFLSGDDSAEAGQPIADLFPECTVCFADIASKFLFVQVTCVLFFPWKLHTLTRMFCD